MSQLLRTRSIYTIDISHFSFSADIENVIECGLLDFVLFRIGILAQPRMLGRRLPSPAMRQRALEAI
jgi:hypothetical protein